MRIAAASLSSQPLDEQAANQEEIIIGLQHPGGLGVRDHCGLISVNMIIKVNLIPFAFVMTGVAIAASSKRFGCSCCPPLVSCYLHLWHVRKNYVFIHQNS